MTVSARCPVWRALKLTLPEILTARLGTSTRKVGDLVKALGADSGISKSEVSRICADLDTEVAAFRDRPP